jgi:hypothetical protein
MEEYGIPDEDNPEWTKEKFASSIRFKDLPESLQRTLSKLTKASRDKRLSPDKPMEQSQDTCRAVCPSFPDEP